MSTYFIISEAERKIGKRVKNIVNFSSIPVGTTGVVVGMYMYRNNLYGVDVQWDLPSYRKPLVDGFSKDEYEDFLDEVGS